MSTIIETTSNKSGRTPEQQAARDARKAAKANAALASQPHAESSTQALKAASPLADGEQSEKKRKRKSAAQDDVEGNVEDEDLLEIDVEAPEPLSKAEARAARKRAKKGLPEAPPKVTKPEKRPKAEDGEDDEGKGEKKSAVKERQNSIWVGNLSFRTTEESLKEYLRKGIAEMGGKAEGSITRVKLPKKAGKGEFAPNRGFAYVDFATPELQILAVGLSESFFEGRKLLIKRGDDHVANPDARTPKPEKSKLDPMAAGILKRQPNPESSTLFMGNLPFDATEEGIRDMIEENAVLAEAKSKGAASVKKEEEESDKDESEEEEDEEEDEDEENEDAPKGVSQEKGVRQDGGRGGKIAGLRKVRLGAFEDTGKCKGFAFLDFLSTEEATKSLVNRHNHFYGSRKLNFQYASESATKRSGGGAKTEVRPGGRKPLKPQFKAFGAGADDSGEGAESGETPVPAVREPRKNDHRGKKWEVTGRPRPGAALAMAKRENVSIVKGEGKKITFDS